MGAVAESGIVTMERLKSRRKVGDVSPEPGDVRPLTRADARRRRHTHAACKLCAMSLFSLTSSVALTQNHLQRR